MLAEGQSSLGATVASASTYLGGWLGSLAQTATGSAPPQAAKPKYSTSSAPGINSSQPPSESMAVSFENLVKDCQVELVEYLTADCSQDPNQSEQIINSIEVMGEVNVKAQLPGETPKVQVKLALPEDFDDFQVHNLCTKTSSKDDELIYRLGNQRFGVATIVPPATGCFSLMKYVSREDKSLQLPFGLTCHYKPRSSDCFDFLCTFRLSKLIDMATDEPYFPII